MSATPNPLAAARKLSSSKHLLVRNDSFTEMRHQQQAEMAQELANAKPATATSTLAPEGAVAVATVSAPAVVVPVVGGKGEEEAAVGGAAQGMPAAS